MITDVERLRTLIYEVLLSHEQEVTHEVDRRWSLAMMKKTPDQEEQLDRVIRYTIAEGEKRGSDQLTRKIVDILRNFS